MLTGALTAYWIRSAPALPEMSVRSRWSSCSREPERAKARTVMRSSPAPAWMLSTARLWKTVKSSSPSSPNSVTASVIPLLRKPRVVRIVENWSSALIPLMSPIMSPSPSGTAVRSDLNSWPTWKRSEPKPPKTSIVARLSSKAK